MTRSKKKISVHKAFVLRLHSRNFELVFKQTRLHSSSEAGSEETCTRIHTVTKRGLALVLEITASYTHTPTCAAEQSCDSVSIATAHWRSRLWASWGWDWRAERRWFQEKTVPSPGPWASPVGRSCPRWPPPSGSVCPPQRWCGRAGGCGLGGQNTDKVSAWQTKAIPAYKIEVRFSSWDQETWPKSFLCLKSVLNVVLS